MPVLFSVSRPQSQSTCPPTPRTAKMAGGNPGIPEACWTVVVLVFGSPGVTLGQSPADACPDHPRTSAVSGPHYQHLSFAKNPVEEALRSPEMPGFGASEDASQSLSLQYLYITALKPWNFKA